MADTENREDQKISECLREAFGYSDDQLLKQLDQANETFKDVNFTGAEDRLMKRFLHEKPNLKRKPPPRHRLWFHRTNQPTFKLQKSFQRRR